MTLKWGYQFQIPPQIKNCNLKKTSIVGEYESSKVAVDRFPNVLSFFETNILKTWGSLYDAHSKLDLVRVSKVMYYKTREILIIRPKANRFCTNVMRQRWAPKINLKKMGVSPCVFFFVTPIFFFFYGRISPRRPSSAHLFFWGGTPIFFIFF